MNGQTSEPPIVLTRITLNSQVVYFLTSVPWEVTNLRTFWNHWNFNWLIGGSVTLGQLTLMLDGVMATANPIGMWSVVWPPKRAFCGSAANAIRLQDIITR